MACSVCGKPSPACFCSESPWGPVATNDDVFQCEKCRKVCLIEEAQENYRNQRICVSCLSADIDATYERMRNAAPDLLGAAHAALKLLRGSGFTENTKALADLREAIRKAEG